MIRAILAIVASWQEHSRTTSTRSSLRRPRRPWFQPVKQSSTGLRKGTFSLSFCALRMRISFSSTTMCTNQLPTAIFESIFVGLGLEPPTGARWSNCSGLLRSGRSCRSRRSRRFRGTRHEARSMHRSRTGRRISRRSRSISGSHGRRTKKT